MELNSTEQNLIKDILKAIGNDDELTREFASAIGMREDMFNSLCDCIFEKLQNGRLTVLNT